jgi:hypothetical protein
MGIYCAPFIADLFLYVNSKKGIPSPHWLVYSTIIADT